MTDKTKRITRRYLLPALALLLAMLSVFLLGDKLVDLSQEDVPESTEFSGIEIEGDILDADGSYTSKEDVAKYLYLYKRLPKNFITKAEARELGWSGGGLERYAPGKCIGGDVFSNREGNLPKKPGRNYYECDIDTLGKESRGAKRIVYSNDGLVYYTDDHYDTFTLMYGVED